MIPESDSSQIPTRLAPQEVRFLADRGVALCRQGEWKRGYEVLQAVAETEHREAELPGVFHSYLGYTVARYRRDYSVALALARHATETRFFEPENFLNLARIELLAGNRRQAHEDCIKGLSLDPRHPDLRRLLKQMGRRGRPAFAFLPRSSALNRALGRLRHRLARSGNPDSADD